MPLMQRLLLALAVLLVVFDAVPLSAQDSKIDTVAARKYTVALGFQRKQLYAQAAQRWQAFIKAYPKSARLASAHHHLGVCRLRQQKFAEAAASFKMVLDKFPKFQSRDSAQFNLGKMYREGKGVLRDYSKAMKWHRMAAEWKPPSRQWKPKQ